MNKTISLTYQGYWREPNFKSAPQYSGVYTFIECRYNPVSDSVTLVKILYIGQADNIRYRVLNHDKLTEMRKSLSYGNQLCIHCAPIENYTYSPDKNRAEAALIYKHQPPFNDRLKDRFAYDATTISNSGRYSLLVQNFTVYRTAPIAGRWY